MRSTNCKKSPREKLKDELQALIAYRLKGVCISKQMPSPPNSDTVGCPAVADSLASASSRDNQYMCI